MSTLAPKPLTLYATDLDGTLLGPDARLSERSAAMYRSLTERGVMLTFITARSPATIAPILQDVHPQLSGVCMTGCAIWNPATRLYEDVIYHSPEDALRICDICQREGVTPFVYTMAHGSNHIQVYHSAERLTELERRFVEDRTLNDLKAFNLHQMAPRSTADSTLLFFGMGEPDKVQAAAAAICQQTNCSASCYPDTYHPGVTLLEVFAPGVSKAAGLLRLKRLLGADRVVAFGDNLNDIPMLQAADVAVAVENAHDQVKEAASVVIGPNTADSVLEYINDIER